MPTISMFYGIKIFLNYNDHIPSHFHAEYGEYQVKVFLDGWVVEGNMPGRAMKLILEWAELHRNELLEDWELAKQRKKLNSIQPLK